MFNESIRQHIILNKTTVSGRAISEIGLNSTIVTCRNISPEKKQFPCWDY